MKNIIFKIFKYILVKLGRRLLQLLCQGLLPRGLQQLQRWWYSKSNYSLKLSLPMVKLFLESIVMLIGGRTTNNRKNMKPWFLSLNPTLVPLPACLTGSKTNIDRIRRHHAPLIIGQGIMLAKFYRCNVMQGNLITTCNLAFLSDGKPLMCGGAANNRECHSYEGPF